MKNDKANQSGALLNAPPLKTVLVFAVPIILGNIFQQLYNIVDAIVVGRFLGDSALNGISIAAPIMDIFYSLLLGVSIGVGVLVGRLSGAGDWEKLKRVHITTLFAGGAVSLFFTLAGLLFSRSILLRQGYSAESVAEAMRYLVIIFSGLIFCFFYNYLASALRSWGNSRLPFTVLPQEVSENILNAVQNALKPGGRFVAYQYSSIMKPKLAARFSDIRTKFVPINIPPAFVYDCGA